MQKEIENLSAFPLNEFAYNMNYAGGMTLRDYFAAKAMQALVSRAGFSQGEARQAYYIADAMLKERQK